MKNIIFFLSVTLLASSFVHGTDILIPNSHGDFVYLEVGPDETIEEIQVRAESVTLEAQQSDEALVPMSAVRDFYTELSPKEQADIRFIVTTLSDNPTPKLLFHKSSLDHAGDRINHIHPLNFLGFIFSDPELKVKIRNIRSKSWVWKTFMSGLKSSLNEEFHRDNLLPDHYDEFTKNIGIEMRKLDHSASRARWDDMVNTLIKYVAHETNADRYNM